MKKYLLAASIAACLGIAACGGNSGSAGSTTDTTEKAGSTPTGSVAADIANSPDYQKGLALISKNDCLTCHQISGTGTGPAYQDVANKYMGADDATISALAQKVIKGGSGVWGTVPMTPHPDLSVDDAKQMIKYILLLKTK